jgi:hypothetical protein
MPLCAIAQAPGVNIEIFGNGGVVSGIAPIEFNGGNRALMYAGAMGNVGLQGEHVAGGIGVRYVEFRADQDLGGGALDAFLLAEFRRRRDARTSLRVTFGGGDDTFDSGRSGGSFTHTSGSETWSIGLGHEVPLGVSSRLLVTVDFLDTSSADSPRRKGPAIEIGVGIRGRRFQEIRPIPPGGR